MTNLEYISSSPELFLKFVKSIKEVQANPDLEEYSEFINWLSQWVNAIRPEEIYPEQVWFLITVEENYFSLSSFPHIDLEKRFTWECLKEKRTILVENENNNETVDVKAFYSSIDYSYEYKFIVPKKELFKYGIFLGTIKDLPEFNPLIKSFFSNRISNNLKEYGIIGLRQLCNLDYKNDLRSIMGLGAKSREEIINRLEALSQTEEYSWILNSNLIKTYNSWAYSYWTY